MTNVRGKIDSYFLSEPCAYSGKRMIKTGALKVLGGLVLAGLLVVLLLVDTQQADIGSVEVSARPSLERDLRTVGAAPPIEALGQTIDYLPAEEPMSRSQGAGWSPTTPAALRQYSASQVVGPGEGGGRRSAISTGSAFGAVLVHRALSQESGSPIHALIQKDVDGDGEVAIPAGTQAIGSAQFDQQGGRLQTRFHTLVFPDGQEHAFNGIALMPDGSAGIAGSVHSGAALAQTGRFLSTFVGGLTEGLKDKSPTEEGIVFEPGSMRNGVLNGLSMSALDQAKSFSDEVARTKPYLEVPAGTPFLIYLEKGFGG